MSRRAPAVLALALIGAGLAGEACVVGATNPGHRLVRRKCVSCHREPSRERIRRRGVDELLAAHGKRVKLGQADVEALRSYVEGKP